MALLGRVRRSAPLAAAALAALVAGAAGACLGVDDWVPFVVDNGLILEHDSVDTVEIAVSSDDASTLSVSTTDQYGTEYQQASSLGYFNSCFQVGPVKLLGSPGKLTVTIECHNFLYSCPVHYNVKLMGSTRRSPAPAPSAPLLSPARSPSSPRPSSSSLSISPTTSPGPSLLPPPSPSFGGRTSTCQTQTACAKACGGAAFIFSDTDSAGSSMRICKAFPSGLDCCPTVPMLAPVPVPTTSLAQRSAVWEVTGIAAALSFVAAYTNLAG